MHHSDSGSDRVGARPPVSRRSTGLDRAGVGAQHPEREAHQRRLARSVLAEQRVKRACPHVELRAVERDRVAELLRDAAKGERERGVGHSPVGAATKVHGTPNVADTRSASARTPRVSVA